jgi:hypothetical protein
MLMSVVAREYNVVGVHNPPVWALPGKFLKNTSLKMGFKLSGTMGKFFVLDNKLQLNLRQ